MLELLDSMLTASAEFHDALAVRCASAHQTVRMLALYAGVKFMEPSIDRDDSRLHAWSQLIQVLQHHTNQTSWAAALLQVPISQLPGILPTILCTHHEVYFKHEVLPVQANTDHSSDSQHLIWQLATLTVRHLDMPHAGIW